MTKARVWGVVALSLAIGCGGSFTEMKTKHFIAYSTKPRDHRLSLLRLEFAYAALSSSFFPKTEPAPVEVLFLDNGSFTGLLGLRRRAASLARVPGGGAIGKGGLIVLREEDTGRLEAEMLAHQFLHEAMPQAPLWLHVSLASYLRTLEYREAEGGQGIACFGRQQGLEGQIPLKELFSTDWDQYDEGPRRWYDDTARMLMDFIVHGDKGSHFSKLPSILTAAGQGVDGPTILAQAFPGMSLAALNTRVTDFRRNQGEQMERDLMCPLPVPIKPGKEPDEGDPRERPAPPEAIEALRTALERLPRREGFPAWFPPEKIPEP